MKFVAPQDGSHNATRVLEPPRLWTRTEVLARPCSVPASADVYAWFFNLSSVLRELCLKHWCVRSASCGLCFSLVFSKIAAPRGSRFHRHLYLRKSGAGDGFLVLIVIVMFLIFIGIAAMLRRIVN